MLGHRGFSGHKKRQFRVNLHHIALLKCQFSALNSKVGPVLSSAHDMSSACSQPGQDWFIHCTGRFVPEGGGEQELDMSQLHPSIAVTSGHSQGSPSSCYPRDGPCVPAEGDRPAQLKFHAMKFPLLPVKVQAWMVLGGVDHPHPVPVSTQGVLDSWAQTLQNLRPGQLPEWALGILEKGWGAQRVVWGGLGAVLRLCPCEVLWDPTSSLWYVIPQHGCQGTGDAG